MSIHKEYSLEEIAESFIFPEVVTGKERDEILAEFQKFRRAISASETDENKYKNQLLQLKFILQDYLESPKFNPELDFGYFLDQYIKRLGISYTEFAKDIGVGVSTISQIMGKHRKPADRLVWRLHIHSNENFPASLWYRLLEKEKVYELENNKSILENESKYVKHSLGFILLE